MTHEIKHVSRIVDRLLESTDELTNCTALEFSTAPYPVKWSMDEEYTILVISALETLALILSRTGLTVQSLEIDIGLRRIMPDRRVADLDLSPYKLPLPHLRKLSLIWCLPPGDLFSRVREFIVAATNLEELRLDLQWTHGPEIFYICLAAVDKLPPIRHLVLYDRDPSFRILVDRLRRTLVSVKILRVNLDGQAWLDIVDMVKRVCPNIESIACDNPPRRTCPRVHDDSSD
jgi:hypothetical protein